jgi:hypothetical protein
MGKPADVLLADIYGVLEKINTNIQTLASKPEPKKESTIGKMAEMGVISSLLNKKGGAAQMAGDIEKLKTAMKGINLVRLNELNKIVSEYNKIPTKSGAITNVVKDMAKAFAYIGMGILSFVGAFGIAKNVIGVSPWEVLGFILASAGVLSVSMMVLAGGEVISDKFSKKMLGGEGFEAKADNNRTVKAVKNAKDMGIALMFVAGGIASFAGGLVLSGVILGVSPYLVPVAVMGMMLLLGGSMVILAELTSIGGEKGKGKQTAGDAIDNAKSMGIALMFVAGGVLSFAISMALVPKILGKGGNAWVGLLEIVGIMAAITGMFALLAFASEFIQPGIKTAEGMGIAVGIISLSILAVAFTSKLLLEMFRSSKTVTDKEGKEHKQKGGPLSAVWGALAGLGVFGLFLGGLAGMLWIMGMPFVAGPIALGSLALLGMAGGLILTAKAVRDVTKVMAGMNVKDLRKNIGDMVGGVMGGVIDGVMGSGLHKTTGEASEHLTIAEVRQFRRIKRVIHMLGSISKSLSQFAMGLRAFAKLGEIASLDYVEDKDGNMKPVIGKSGKIHVKEIAKSIADTFGIFIKSLVENTQGLTRTQARSLKILGKALTGERGLISGVNQFSQTLITYAKFGALGKIWVPPQYADETAKTGLVEGTGVAVDLPTIVNNIVKSFMAFVDALASRAGEFSAAGASGKKMMDFSEILMGREKGFLGRRAKPGLLSAITSFSDTLTTYAEYGKDGLIPVKNDKGEIIPGKTIKIEDVAVNMVTSIAKFVNSFGIEMEKQGLEKISKDIKGKISNFTDIVTSFGKMADAQEGLDKLANSVGLLATNIGLLVTNMSALKLDNLQKLQQISAQNAIVTKGITIPPVGATPTGGTTGTVAAPPVPTDWNAVAEMIGNKIAEKMANTGTYEFRFYDTNVGVLTHKPH